MGLNAKQKEAVEYLEGPLLVLAGPGTGKTQLLSEKVAYILENTDTSPENILCLTFTESGTANMCERLKSIIGPVATKVNINTYHAFGSEILAYYKNYSESYDRKLDAAIDEVTQFKIVKNIQSKLSGTDILRGDNIKDIIDAVSSAKSARLTATDLKVIAEQNLADSKVLSEAISPLLQNIVPRKFEESYRDAYQPIYAILKDYDQAPPILKDIDRSIKSLAADLSAAMAEAEETKKIRPLSDWKDTYFEKDEKGQYRLKDRIANKKLLSLANIVEKYDAYLKENGLYDFEDMIEEAVKVLKEDAGFRLTLSEKYQFILLDEFQDTNPSQFEIIKQLTDYEKPLIMAVGDDDQAIYEFQGASATNLTTFRDHFNAHVVPLVENYRSTQEILDFSREIINQTDDRFADKKLIAHKDALKESGISRHEFISSDAEYAWVSDQIAKLIDSGVKQFDIAIISYKTKYFMPLLPYLKSHPKINIAYEKQNNLLEDPKIHEIIAIADFVVALANNKTPTVSLLEILSYPFWNLPMLEVIKLTNRAKTDKKSALEYLAESENEDLKNIANFFANLAASSLNDPFEITLDYILGTAELSGFRSPFLNHYAEGLGADYAALTLYENLASLRGDLKKYCGDRATRLGDLVDMAHDYKEADLPINVSSPYRDADDAVQVLSAHKAKGLEFEYVFIISADHMAWGKGKGNNNMLALPKNLVQIRHTGVTDSEKLRVLYVALTRPKSHLIITNSLSDFNGKSPERLEYLNEFTDQNKVVISPFIPSKEVVCHYEPITAVNVESIRNWLTSFVTPSPDLRAIYKERLKNYRLSASALTSFIDVVYAGPQEFFKRQILRAPEEPSSEALAFGNLIHKTFEKVTTDHIDNAAAIEFFLSELNKETIEPDTLAKLREKGPADLAVSLDVFGEILRAGKAEVNVAQEKISVAGVPLTGKIDHITVNDTEKTIELYDFKTGNYHKEKWENQPTLFKYALQLGFYKLLLNNSPTYAKYKISRAHILFVTPDKDGEVHDKVYEFTPEAEDLLVNLIKAVYGVIEDLSFLDDPDIFIAPDDSKTIKDIKEFIKLILAKNAEK